MIAKFKEGERYAYTEDIYQYDYGQILEIHGLSLSPEVEVHFSISEHDGDCERRIGTTKDGVTEVQIPDALLKNQCRRSEYFIYAFIYISDEISGETKYIIKTRVICRPAPGDIETKDGPDFVGQLMGKLNTLEEEKLTRPDSAKVGQVLAVKSTDEDGKVKEVEAVNAGGASEEEIKNAVDSYLEKNPIKETDPTVPEWAKQPKKPSYTASEVGADAVGTAEGKVSEHNVAADAHNDIRELISGLTQRLNALADSDDTTLDQMSEVVAYIKSNKILIDAITTSKVSVSDIVDNLTTNLANKPLSAAQGVVLKRLIETVQIELSKIVIPTKTSQLQNDSNFISSPDTATVGQVLEVESVDENGKPTAWKTVTLEDGIANVEMTENDTDVILEPMPKAYIFPEMSALTITLTEGKEKEMYHFSVISGATATTLTLNGVTVSTDSASIEANKTYEVDIWNQIAIVRAVA